MWARSCQFKISPLLSLWPCSCKALKEGAPCHVPFCHPEDCQLECHPRGAPNKVQKVTTLHLFLQCFSLILNRKLSNVFKACGPYWSTADSLETSLVCPVFLEHATCQDMAGASLRTSFHPKQSIWCRPKIHWPMALGWPWDGLGYPCQIIQRQHQFYSRPSYQPNLSKSHKQHHSWICVKGEAPGLFDYLYLCRWMPKTAPKQP